MMLIDKISGRENLKLNAEECLGIEGINVGIE